MPTCLACATPARLIRGRCGRCYHYWLRHGTERPPAVDALGTRRACTACGFVTLTPRRGWCDACYMRWFRRQRAGGAA